MTDLRRREPRWWLALLLPNLALLPLLLLMPLGVWWLWQQGYLYWWAGVSTILGLTGYLYVRLLRRQLARPRPGEPDAPVALPGADWSPRDQAAWNDVRAWAREADPAIVNDYRRMLRAAATTLEKVAVHYHRESRHAIWNFTVPEALLLIERIATRLRGTVLEKVPGSHLLRVRQVVRLWTWKPIAERGAGWWRGANKLWRVARWANPAGALLAETRQLATAAAWRHAGDYLRRRGVRIWIEEVGRAGIELYSGRLAVEAATLQEHVAADASLAASAQHPLPGPLRLVVVGQGGTDKSGVIDALRSADGDSAGDARVADALRRDGLPETVLLYAPDLTAETDIDATVARAFEGDCLLWVTAAHRADRALETEALRAIRERFAADTRRLMPPVVVVATQIERLSPAREWAPPYDLENPVRPKEQAIRGARDAIARDLDVPAEHVIPVRVAPRAQAYNLERLAAALADCADAADRARALRLLATLPRPGWRKIFEQTRRLIGGIATQKTAPDGGD